MTLDTPYPFESTDEQTESTMKVVVKKTRLRKVKTTTSSPSFALNTEKETNQEASNERPGRKSSTHRSLNSSKQVVEIEQRELNTNQEATALSEVQHKQPLQHKPNLEYPDEKQTPHIVTSKEKELTPTSSLPHHPTAATEDKQRNRQKSADAKHRNLYEPKKQNDPLTRNGSTVQGVDWEEVGLKVDAYNNNETYFWSILGVYETDKVHFHLVKKELTDSQVEIFEDARVTDTVMRGQAPVTAEEQWRKYFRDEVKTLQQLFYGKRVWAESNTPDRKNVLKWGRRPEKMPQVDNDSQLFFLKKQTSPTKSTHLSYGKEKNKYKKPLNKNFAVR